MVYCKTCYTGAHWNCLGTDVQIVEYTKNSKSFYFFECDKCKYKGQAAYQHHKYISYNGHNIQSNYACIACDKDSGLLKAFEV